MTRDELVNRVADAWMHDEPDWRFMGNVWDEREILELSEKVLAEIGRALMRECEQGAPLLGADVGLGIAWTRIRKLTQPETSDDT